MADYRDLAAALGAGYGQDTGPITADTLQTLKSGYRSPNFLGMLADIGRGSLSNLESLVRGGVAQVPGTAGDIEALARMGLNKSFGAGGVNVNQETALPTTADIMKMLPQRMTQARPETAGMEELGTVIGPGLGKAVKPLAKAYANLALEDIAMASTGQPTRSLLGDITPKPKFIFMGENSKTWNKDAADTAVKMEKAGASPEDIWAATGTFRGAEGKLRQEISDSSAKFKPAKWDQPYEDATEIDVTNIASALHHPELYKAYPQLGEANLILNPNISSAGEWNRANPSSGVTEPFMQMNKSVNPSVEIDWLKRMLDPNSIDYWKNQARYAIKEGFSPRQAIKDMRQHIAETEQNISQLSQGVIPGDPRIALHELQHGVQEVEGFAKGGSPRWAAQEKEKMLTRMNFLNTELSEAAKGLDKYPKNSPQYKQYRETYDAAMAEKMQLNPILIQNSPDEIYRRLAGEVEARAVEKRRNMTDEQRRATFPLKSYENPINDLILRK